MIDGLSHLKVSFVNTYHPLNRWAVVFLKHEFQNAMRVKNKNDFMKGNVAPIIFCEKNNQIECQ